VTVAQDDAATRVGEDFLDAAAHFNQFFLGQMIPQ
jgi:hypothetical protein